MHRITIQYAADGDTAGFDERYLTEHVPLVTVLPGLQAMAWSKPRPLGGPAVVHLVTELDFADADALKSALKSPEMAKAGEHAAGLGLAMTMFSGEVVPVAIPGS